MALTSKEFKDFGYRQGVDVIGIARAEDLPKAEPLGSPEHVMPGAKSAIVFGLMMPTGAYSSYNTRVQSYHSLQMYFELDRICYELCRFLEKRGYRAAGVPPHYPLEQSRRTAGLMADMRYKPVAYYAGLGVRGKSNLVITPEFGPRVRMGGLVTDAVLESGTPMTANYCDGCQLCLDACPVGALGPDGKYDAVKCLLKLNPWGLPQFRDFLADLFNKTDEERRKALRSPHFWNLYTTLGATAYYDCDRCLEACPVGKRQGEK